MKKNKKNKGFTLIEILVVIGIIAILAAIVIIAINPARQFAQARNSQRTSNVNVILNAIGQRMADNKGIFGGTGIDGKVCPSLPSALITVPSSITAAVAATLGAKEMASTVAAGNVDLGCLAPTYISALPSDPNGGTYQWTNATNYDTGYFVVQDNTTGAGGRITVYAANPESALNQVNYISVTR